MKKKLTRGVLIAVLIIGGVLLLSPEYFRRALIYTTADITDYKLFDNRVVKTGKPEPWAKDAAYNSFKISEEHRKAIEKLDPVAFFVLQNQKVRYEEYWDGYGPESLSNSFSMAKSIVSLLVGIAVDEGKIKSLDQAVGDFVPAFAEGENAKLKIRDVLTMSSGLNWDESYGNPFSVTTKAYYGTNLRALIDGLKVVEKPGVEFKYLSGNTQLLAMVLESATGKDLADYAGDKLWSKIGALHPALWSVDRKKDGIEKAYCCFNSNAPDFARIGQLVLNGGEWDGQQVVSGNYVKEATKPASYLVDKSGKPVDFYGFQWWVVNYKGVNVPYCRGILGQYIFVIPNKNAVVVRLGNKRAKKKIGPHPEDVYLYLDTAMKMLD
ncbi:hypothetical protein FUAX_26730 [Fulvitalea axinellae]|uniref:Beta-lactamase-related domain-containing protein n=1 Tax=Fulvitalea axinellae TaxID=1182444 RepID=A0AAU9DB26_9BACT|nr:hypothetical protein FUAX_26730 [Fulvitalea axinellae]